MAGTTLMTEEAMNADNREVVRRAAAMLMDYSDSLEAQGILGTAREASRLAAALSTPPPPEPLSTEGVDDAMIERALHALVPGGAEVWCWLPQKDSFTPHETARDVMRCALEAALAQTHPVSSPGEGWREDLAEAREIIGDLIPWDAPSSRWTDDQTYAPSKKLRVGGIRRAQAFLNRTVPRVSASPAQPARQQDQGLTASPSPPSPTLQAARAQSQHVDGKGEP